MATGSLVSLGLVHKTEILSSYKEFGQSDWWGDDGFLPLKKTSTTAPLSRGKERAVGSSLLMSFL
jgi:hypothetical protein